MTMGLSHDGAVLRAGTLCMDYSFRGGADSIVRAKSRLWNLGSKISDLKFQISNFTPQISDSTFRISDLTFQVFRFDVLNFQPSRFGFEIYILQFNFEI